PTLLSLSCPFSTTSPAYLHALSLHDALPIFTTSSSCRHRSVSCITLRGRSTTSTRSAAARRRCSSSIQSGTSGDSAGTTPDRTSDRKSTRLNSSHQIISYAVFCLTKNIHLTQ